MADLTNAPAYQADGEQAFSICDPRPADHVRHLIEHSPIASVVSNPRLPDNPLVAVNRPFIELTGYGPEEILGRNCRFLAGDGTEPWLTETIREGVRERKPVLVEILNYKKSGEPFRNAVLVAPIFGDDDELEYFLGSQVEDPLVVLDPGAARRRPPRACFGYVANTLAAPVRGDEDGRQRVAQQTDRGRAGPFGKDREDAPQAGDGEA